MYTALNGNAVAVRSEAMKYILLIYNNPANMEALSEAERNAIFGEVDAIMQELTESGEWIGGAGLANPLLARTVRVRNGTPVVTDRPFAEAKEQLAGYCIIECESIERATEIAARWPDARYGTMEVRPLMDAGAEEL
jgi:hypothetical protein